MKHICAARIASGIARDNGINGVLTACLRLHRLTKEYSLEAYQCQILVQVGNLLIEIAEKASPSELLWLVTKSDTISRELEACVRSKTPVNADIIDLLVMYAKILTNESKGKNNAF